MNMPRHSGVTPAIIEKLQSLYTKYEKISENTIGNDVRIGKERLRLPVIMKEKSLTSF